jgi:hypothetical protein
MRSIKFRVAYKTDERQDTEKPGWIMSQPFRLVDLEPGGDTTEFDFSDGGYLGTNDINWDSPDLVWLEYTGLMDKNDKEIYEGNILEFLGRKGSIFWSDQGLWGVKWHNDNVLNWRLFAFYKTSGVEVIGNIYENPELLEVAY